MTDLDKMIVAYETRDFAEGIQVSERLSGEGIFVQTIIRDIRKFAELTHSVKLLVNPSDYARALVVLKSVEEEKERKDLNRRGQVVVTDLGKMIVVYETLDETEARHNAGILIGEGIFVHTDVQGVWKFGEFIPSIKLLVKPLDRNRAVIALRPVASHDHDVIIDEPGFSIEEWKESQKKRNDPNQANTKNTTHLPINPLTIYKIVYGTSNETEAQIVAEILQAEGIQANVHLMRPGPTTGPLSLITVQVRSPDYDHALSILQPDEFLNTTEDNNPTVIGDDDPDRTD